VATRYETDPVRTIFNRMDTEPITPIVAHVRERIYDYFEELHGTSVQVVVTAADRRRQSTLYWLDVQAGERHRRLLVKVSHPARPLAESVPAQRPRLGLVGDRHVKDEFEYRGLVAVHDHFGALADRRFGTVRAFDYIPEAHALVMEVVEEPTLRRLLVRTARFTPPFARTDLSVAFRNTGAWLRVFHELPPRGGDALPVLRQTPDDVVRACDAFTSYLGERVSADGLPDRILAAVAAHAHGTLPDRLPLGLGHGDYAPRNVFVQRDGRVRVIDMLARRRVPVYEDLAYFTVSLRTTGLQLLLGELAFDRVRMRDYKEAFIRGYFHDDEPPRRALALYELVVLLDKWSAHVAARPDAAGPRQIVRRVHVLAADRRFAAEAQRLLTVIEPA
jgi:hypothetical protein